MPNEILLEEFKVPGHDLYLDFFLPHRRLAVEIQGRQHGVFVPFFHKTKAKFNRAVDRDGSKVAWCEMNNIILLTVESVEDLKEKLE